MDNKEAFVRELVALLDKHHAHVASHTIYDGHDNPCGDEYTISGEGWSFDLDSLVD